MLSGLSAGHILITLAVILLVFGTGKLRNAGSDIGAALKQFKRSVNEDESTSTTAQRTDQENDQPR
ncbi:twin-arginine translocase TatA/TatE family subunit [Carnimonas nigrificans]|uniref:twin-arginine translocase TatA/TatE family subunit n=1 Tax=Carnimonas nigrificans TaxID=64323 RepID=UPI00046EFB78|nr:twin-arginine translocase TatA/TatE family subunit [Carnimonas nigrificans]